MIASENTISDVDRDFNLCFYDTEMEARLMRKQGIERELSQIAMGENVGHFYFQYQPILDIKTNLICGFEALARFNSDSYGRVSPVEFIAKAEETKLIVPLGQQIILQVFRFINSLKEKGYDEINVAINISVVQLLRTGFVKNLIALMEEMHIKPEDMGIEITESVFASDYQEINESLSELHALGIKIAIDDFGTGYSSLARERELNVSCLKIDQSFIHRLLTLKGEEAITGDVISMAHKRGHFVIAEGVEHERQLQYLKDHGCDKVQGYLISRPLDEEAAFELLKKQASTKKAAKRNKNRDYATCKIGSEG